jgi:hypothetical protein
MILGNSNERNGVIVANLINLEFLFSDSTAAEYSMNRYFGLYANFVEEAKRSSEEKKLGGITFPKVFTHSANPIGSANIMGYVNNFYRNERQPQSCIRVQIDHTRIDV